MAHIQDSIMINASSEEINRLLTTPALIVQWYEGVDEVFPSKDYPAVGASIAGTYKTPVKDFEVKQTMLEYQPGQHIRYKMEGMVEGTSDWIITETGGGCKLEIVFDFHLGGGILSKIADPAVAKVNEGNARTSLQKLKQLAER